MSTFLRRGFALFLLLLAAALLHPVDTTAQNLPGWAEPSEQRESRFESRLHDGHKMYNPSEVTSNSQRESTSPSRIYRNPGAGTRDLPGGAPPTKGLCQQQTEPVPECTKFCSRPENRDAKQCKRYFDKTDATPIPVDDYLPFLMLAGIAYAALRLRQ
jgi:hypothetical protein